MEKNFKKLVLVVCMVVCIGSVCAGCSTDTENDQNTEPQSTEQQQSIEQQGDESSEVIEKEIEIDSDSGEKIEYSLEGSAEDEDTQSDNNTQEKTKE